MQRDLAHCYAHLGKHAKARELCDAVLAVLDRVFRERGRDQKTVDYYLDPVERLLATIASGEDAVKSHLSSIVEHNWQELKLVYK